MSTPQRLRSIITGGGHLLPAPMGSPRGPFCILALPALRSGYSRSNHLLTPKPYNSWWKEFCAPSLLMPRDSVRPLRSPSGFPLTVILDPGSSPESRHRRGAVSTRSLWVLFLFLYLSQGRDWGGLGYRGDTPTSWILSETSAVPVFSPLHSLMIPLGSVHSSKPIVRTLKPAS